MEKAPIPVDTNLATTISKGLTAHENINDKTYDIIA